MLDLIVPHLQVIQRKQHPGFSCRQSEVAR
jgi:hypothetical protein